MENPFSRISFLLLFIFALFSLNYVLLFFIISTFTVPFLNALVTSFAFAILYPVSFILQDKLNNHVTYSLYYVANLWYGILIIGFCLVFVFKLAAYFGLVIPNA